MIVWLLFYETLSKAITLEIPSALVSEVTSFQVKPLRTGGITSEQNFLTLLLSFVSYFSSSNI